MLAMIGCVGAGGVCMARWLLGAGGVCMARWLLGAGDVCMLRFLANLEKLVLSRKNQARPYLFSRTFLVLLCVFFYLS